MILRSRSWQNSKKQSGSWLLGHPVVTELVTEPSHFTEVLNIIISSFSFSLKGSNERWSNHLIILICTNNILSYNHRIWLDKEFLRLEKVSDVDCGCYKTIYLCNDQAQLYAQGSRICIYTWFNVCDTIWIFIFVCEADLCILMLYMYAIVSQLVSLPCLIKHYMDL